MSLGDLQIGTQHGHIQRRGRLAHAAAKLVDNLPVDICTRRLVATRLGALADNAVIGKLVARIENRTVNGRSCQPHVIGTRHIALVQIGRSLRKRIAEQHFFEILRRYLGRRDRCGDGVTLRRAVANDAARLFHVKLYAGFFRNDGLAVGLVDRRARPLADRLGSDLVNVNGRGFTQLG